MENQLKATELRLNNVVDYNGMQLPVFGIVSPVFTMTDEYIIELFDGASTIDCKLEDLTSIPLTEDILVKLGFEIEGLRSYYHNDLDVTIEYLSGKYAVAIYDFEINPAVTHYIMHCEFLHTLQNLFFALTGEELTFKK